MKKKRAIARTKENKDREKNARTQTVKPTSEKLSGYRSNILLRGLKFTPTLKRNNIELKSNLQSYTHRLGLAEFFQNKETNNSEENLFQKRSTFETGIEIYII